MTTKKYKLSSIDARKSPRIGLTWGSVNNDIQNSNVSFWVNNSFNWPLYILTCTGVDVKKVLEFMLVDRKRHIHFPVPGSQVVWCYSHQVQASDSQDEAEELYLRKNTYQLWSAFIYSNTFQYHEHINIQKNEKLLKYTWHITSKWHC